MGRGIQLASHPLEPLGVRGHLLPRPWEPKPGGRKGSGQGSSGRASWRLAELALVQGRELEHVGGSPPAKARRAAQAPPALHTTGCRAAPVGEPQGVIPKGHFLHQKLLTPKNIPLATVQTVPTFILVNHCVFSFKCPLFLRCSKGS